MKLSLKLLCGFGLIILTLIIVIGLYQNTITSTTSLFSDMIDHEFKISADAREIDKLMLKCRKDEKNFLLHKDAQYVTAYKQHISDLKKLTSEAIELAKVAQHSEIAANLEKINPLTLEYAQKFNSLVNLWHTRGLDHNSGLQGEFRDCVHSVMVDIEMYQLDKAYIKALQIANSENLLISSTDKENLIPIQNSISQFTRLIKISSCPENAKNSILASVEKYSTALESFNSSNDNRTELIKQISQASENIKTEILKYYIPDISSQVLMVRRSEKDYLLRLTDKYINKTKTNVQTVKDSINNSSIPQESKNNLSAKMDFYLQTFLKLASVDTEINTTTLELSAIVNQIEPLTDKAASFSQNHSSEIVDLAHKRTNIALAIGSLGIIFGILASILISRSIINPIKRICLDLSHGACQVTDASNMVSNNSQELAHRTNEQAASIEEASSNMEDISSRAKDNATNAAQVAGFATNAQDISTETSNAMKQMINSIELIKQSSDKTATVIKTIDEIAFQTNLLALNAAVEAARAGESGKGFAVVAEEVRSLAMRSAEAARSTSSLIEESNLNANKGVEIVENVAESLEKITSAIDQINSLVINISSAADQQNSSIQTTKSAITGFESITQKNAANAEESAGTSEELSAQATQTHIIIAELMKIIGLEQTTNTSGQHSSLTDELYHNIANGSSNKEFNFTNTDNVSS